MFQLTQTIPNPDLLLALEPEELAAKILFLLRQRSEPMFHPGNLQKEIWGDATRGQVGYGMFTDKIKTVFLNLSN